MDKPPWMPESSERAACVGTSGTKSGRQLYTSKDIQKKVNHDE
jgi:hypothetical protein